MQAPHNKKSGPDGLTMVLSRFVLGHPAYLPSTYGSQLSKPPASFHSTTHVSAGNQVVCTYDNSQAYPEYVITYKADGAQGPY